MTLGGMNEFILLSLLNFEVLLIVTLNNVPDSVFVDVFTSLSPQALHYFLEWNVPAGLKVSPSCVAPCLRIQERVFEV
jgi:hypothetical protein